VKTLATLTLFAATCQAAAEDYRPTPIEPGTQWAYRGEVARIERDRTTDEAEKTFRLTLVVLTAEEGRIRLGWLVEESGGGEWPWPERVGQLEVSPTPSLDPPSPEGPAVYFQRDDSTGIVDVPLPLCWLPTAEIENGRWSEGSRTATITRPDAENDENNWKIEIRDPLGREQTMELAGHGPVVTKLQRRIFMGRGEEYRMTLRLHDSEQLTGQRFDRLKAEFAAFQQLRDALGRPTRTERTELGTRQIDLLRQQLPRLEETVTGGLLEGVVKVARADFVRQAGRDGDVAALVARYLGKPTGAFQADGLKNARLTDADLEDQITVLHFWDYRHEPLKEPYGQVGYLDFLHEKYARQAADGAKIPVRIYGVAVRRQLTDANRRSAVRRSVSKLSSFMNLSYPILLDDGRLVRQFGDPRTSGATLPLFVVIGPDGRIAHYHVGYYEVQQQRGLDELDVAITAAAAER